MRNLKQLSVIAAILLVPALPAAAQSWGSMANPGKFDDGTPYCMLWFGEDQPMMNFTATADSLTYTVVSDIFKDVAESTPVWFSFGEATNISVAPLRKPRPQEYPGFIAGTVPAQAMSDILTRMTLGSYGETPMTVRAGGTTQDFHLRSSAGDSALFQECRAKL